MNWNRKELELNKSMRELKPKIHYECPRCGFHFPKQTFINQRYIEIQRYLCLKCGIELKPSLTDGYGEKIL
jgi:predicted RNA-binding Zn-ribbon protein involved in translation (DUF1610 family)